VNPTGLVPAAYAASQHRFYALQVFRQYVLERVAERIMAATEGDYWTTHGNELERRIAEKVTVEKWPHDQAILEVTADYINEWKKRVVPDFPNASVGITQTSKKLDYPPCELFCESVQRMAQSIALFELSDFQPFLFPDHSADIEETVAALSIKSPCFPWTLDEVLADPVVASVLANEKDIGFLLLKADEAISTLFNLRARQWAPDSRVMLFLELDALLQDVFFGYPVTDVGPELPKRVVCALVGGKDPVFLRASFFNCMSLLASSIGAAGGLSVLEPTLIEAFRRLASLFDFSTDILPA
jgi:hypothetical protein